MIKEKILELLNRSDFKLLLFNFINYGIYQVLTYIIPLITIPYIVRIIGLEKFGIVSLAQAVCYYLNIISDYGYNISGVQYIAQNQTNPGKSAEIVSTVFSIQFIMMSLCFLFLLGMLNIFDQLKIHQDIFIYAFLIIPANIMMAQWFYIGMEKVKFINYITFISRILYLFFVFLLIKEESDYRIVPLLNSLSVFVAGVYSLIVIVKRFKIKLIKYFTSNPFTQMSKDFAIFTSVIFMNLYRNSNIIILSFFASGSLIGLYSAGEKIIKAIQSTFTPVTQVLYPYISRIKTISEIKSLSIIKYLLLLMAGLSGIILIILILFADRIALLAFGSEFMKTGIVIKICSAVILLGTINYILGVIFMTNYGLKNEFAKSVTLTGITNVIICIILSAYFFEIGAAVSFALSELILLVIIIYYIMRNRKKWIDLRTQH